MTADETDVRQLRFELARRFGLATSAAAGASGSPTTRDDSGIGIGRCDDGGDGGDATTTPGRVGGSNTGARCESGTR